jgi:hypothetical protein
VTSEYRHTTHHKVDQVEECGGMNVQLARAQVTGTNVISDVQPVLVATITGAKTYPSRPVSRHNACARVDE